MRVFYCLGVITGLLIAWPVQVSDSTASGLKLFPVIVPSAGGCIILWTDNRDQCYEVYAEKLNATGQTQWNPDKIVSRDTRVTEWYGHRLSLTAVSDENNGAIAAWINHHSLKRTGDTAYSPGIYVRRVYSNGSMWAYPIFISSSTNPISLCSDGAGGVICAWMEYNANTKIYKVMAERLDSDGALVWTTPIASDTNRLGNPRVAAVGIYVVVVYDSSQFKEDDKWDVGTGGYSYLRTKKIDKNTGSILDTLTLESRSNTHVCNPGPVETYGEWCSPYWWLLTSYENFANTKLRRYYDKG